MISKRATAILPELGVNVHFVHPESYDEIEAAITGKTRILFTETIDNPSLDVANIRAMADIADKHDIPLIVDSTFTTPYLIRPIEHGASVMIHSLTKWIRQHDCG